TRESQFSELDEEVLRIAIEQDDGETVLLWPVINTDVNGNGFATLQAKAIVAAVRKAERKTLEEGGTLAVKFYAEKETKKGNPQKLFQAQYRPPAAAAKPPAETEAKTPEDDGAVDDLL
ncbi:MAG: hypothetical protein GY926_10790, partial [bacterium]|nr:hypothetical protein [bacterium]